MHVVVKSDILQGLQRVPQRLVIHFLLSFEKIPLRVFAPSKRVFVYDIILTSYPFI